MVSPSLRQRDDSGDHTTISELTALSMIIFPQVHMGIFDRRQQFELAAGKTPIRHHGHVGRHGYLSHSQPRRLHAPPTEAHAARRTRKGEQCYDDTIPTQLSRVLVARRPGGRLPLGALADGAQRPRDTANASSASRAASGGSRTADGQMITLAP